MIHQLNEALLCGGLTIGGVWVSDIVVEKKYSTIGWTYCFKLQLDSL